MSFDFVPASEITSHYLMVGWEINIPFQHKNRL